MLIVREGWKSSDWTSCLSSVQEAVLPLGFHSVIEDRHNSPFKTPRSGRVLSSARYTELFNPQLGSWLIAVWPFTSIHINSLEAVLALLDASHSCSQRPRIYTTLLIAISLGTVAFLFFSFPSLSLRFKRCVWASWDGRPPLFWYTPLWLLWQPPTSSFSFS